MEADSLIDVRTDTEAARNRKASEEDPGRRIDWAVTALFRRSFPSDKAAEKHVLESVEIPKIWRISGHTQAVRLLLENRDQDVNAQCNPDLSLDRVVGVAQKLSIRKNVY